MAKIKVMMKQRRHFQLNCYFYSCLSLIKDNKQISLEGIVQNIPQFWNRFAGYESKEKLMYLLSRYAGKADLDTLAISAKKEQEILERAEKVISTCTKTLDFQDTFQIFFFPTSSNFTLDYMKGISGFASFKNTFLIFVHPQSDLSLLEATIAHEYNHAIILNKIRWLTLGEGIVAEGLAENFREDVIGGDDTPWIKSLNKNESRYWFKKIEPYLKEQNRKRYRDIFTNSESEYPHWGGYAIGYWLVKQYLELNSHITWEQVMDKSMGEIIEKSMFGSNLDIKMPVL